MQLILLKILAGTGWTPEMLKNDDNLMQYVAKMAQESLAKQSSGDYTISITDINAMRSAFLIAALNSDSLESVIKLVSLGKGSTGRYTPYNLNEQLAMRQVLSNPLNGTQEIKSITLSDPRWLAQDGWVKMSNNVNGIEIHFVYNKITNAFDDFKFK